MSNKQRIKQLEQRVAELEAKLAPSSVSGSSIDFERWCQPGWQYTPSVTHVIDYGQYTKDGLPVIRWTL